MLFQKRFLDGIRSGTVTIAFRRWRRPTVQGGGTLLTPVGELHIDSVAPVTIDTITEQDALNAGYESQEVLLTELNKRKDGEIYRIELGALDPDPRLVLRDTPATGVELQALRKKLSRLDAHAGESPWTLSVLEVLYAHTGVRAGELCELVGQEKMQFKRNVRKLKNLGLTESLGTGYRLSVRGMSLLDELRRETKKRVTHRS